MRTRPDRRQTQLEIGGLPQPDGDFEEPSGISMGLTGEEADRDEPARQGRPLDPGEQAEDLGLAELVIRHFGVEGHDPLQGGRP